MLPSLGAFASSETPSPSFDEAIVASELSEMARERAASGPALEAEAEALSTRWAPTFVQETSPEHPERDRPLAIDFDADWDATNNWVNLSATNRTDRATVYGSAILTRTHAYLTYTLFYPRDWVSLVCVPYVCHDNDLETALVVVERAPEAHAGRLVEQRADASRLVLIETKSHRSYLTLPATAIARDSLGRPLIRVESGGHGMRTVHEASRLPEGPAFRVYRHGAVGEDPRERSSTESYELLSLHATLWKRRELRAAGGGLWTEGETGPLWYSGARFGRHGYALGASMASRTYAGGVRPPWGLKAERGERGDWFLDPAFVTHARHSRWFEPQKAVSQVYALNPYLEDLVRECSGSTCPEPPASTDGARWARASLSATASGALLFSLGLASALPGRRGLSRLLRALRRSPRR